jgi:hypothetical protein
MFVVVLAVGGVSTYEGRELLEAAIPNLRFLTSTVVGAGATVLALMLTLLVFTLSSEWDFRAQHYQRVSQVSFFTTVAIAVGVILLLVIGLPLEEAEGLQAYYNVMYGLITGTASLLGGLMIAVVLMLYQAIRGLVDIGHPEGESDLIEDHRSR